MTRISNAIVAVTVTFSVAVSAIAIPLPSATTAAPVQGPTSVDISNANQITPSQLAIFMNEINALPPIAEPQSTLSPTPQQIQQQAAEILNGTVHPVAPAEGGLQPTNTLEAPIVAREPRNTPTPSQLTPSQLAILQNEINNLPIAVREPQSTLSPTAQKIQQQAAEIVNQIHLVAPAEGGPQPTNPLEAPIVAREPQSTLTPSQCTPSQVTSSQVIPPQATPTQFTPAQQEAIHSLADLIRSSMTAREPQSTLTLSQLEIEKEIDPVGFAEGAFGPQPTNPLAAPIVGRIVKRVFDDNLADGEHFRQQLASPGNLGPVKALARRLFGELD